MRVLDAGGTLWHAQAAHALRLASPLALRLTHALLEKARGDVCWTEVLRSEAELCASALGSADCAAGAGVLFLHAAASDADGIARLALRHAGIHTSTRLQPGTCGSGAAVRLPSEGAFAVGP